MKTTSLYLAAIMIPGLAIALQSVGCSSAGERPAEADAPDEERTGAAVGALEDCQPCPGAQACGAIMAWIDDQPAKSNGNQQCCGTPCDGVKGDTYGDHWQCVELAQRYFAKKFETADKWPVGAAREMCDRAVAGTRVHWKGDGYTPVHGDLIVLDGGAYGHVAVVNTVSGGTVDVVEQNSSVDGTNTYSISKARCFIHAEKNTGGGGGGGGGASCATLQNGYYCGNDRVNGDPNTLYQCSGGAIASSAPCPGGCQVMPSGTNDLCTPVPQRCPCHTAVNNACNYASMAERTACGVPSGGCTSDQDWIDGYYAQAAVCSSRPPAPARVGVFRDGVWLLDVNGEGYEASDRQVWWGAPGDIPVVGSWDGSGQAHLGVARVESNGMMYWHLDVNGNGPDGADRTLQFGLRGDIPVVGDWTGSGQSRVGVFRRGMWVLDTNGNGYDASDKVTWWGAPGDMPVVGSWDGSGRSYLGVARVESNDMLFWYLDMNGNGLDAADRMFPLGARGDIPVVGDWTGTGRTHVGVFRAGAWYLDVNGSGGVERTVWYGGAGYTPVTGAW